MHSFKFPTSEEAWLNLNKSLVLTKPPELEHSSDLKMYRNQVLLYDVFIRIERSHIDPEFDFTKTINYRRAKWTGLVSNYVDKNHLEEVIAAVRHRELKKDKNYNETFHFGNSHSHGKGCLLTCTFSRRYGNTGPMLNAVMRSSEFYKRGMMDLLLLHRLGEEAYGEEPFGVNTLAHQLWGGSDWLSLLYALDKKFIKNLKHTEGFSQEVYKMYRKFKEVENIDGLAYHAHRRACKVIQGKIASPPLLAKDCLLY